MRTRFPSSLAQQRFWVMEQIEPGNPALNVAVRWQLEGEISAVYLEAAWRQVVARQDLLRTFFVESAGEAVQLVEPAIAFAITTVDLTSLPEADAAARAEQLATREARRPFNLSVAPLMRVTLLRLNPQRSILLLTAHHIICDGWSIGLLAAEMGEAYAAMREGRAVDLPALPIQYGEFAEWQREAAAQSPTAMAAWERALAGMRYVEVLPDRPRPARQTTNSTIASILLDQDLGRGVAALARQNDCSMFMVALAALAVLLQRQTGEDDITIGTQIAGRDHVEVEDLVGPFINTLVLRLVLAGRRSFLDLLTHVREVVLLAFEHGQTPLEQVADIARSSRDLSRNPLFSVNFIFQRSFIRAASYGGMRLVDLPSFSAGALYDLNFFMVERPEGWRASCEYNTSLYDPATITGLLGRFAMILRAAAAGPTQPLAAIPVMDAAGRQALLADWAGPAAAYPQDMTLPQLFAAQVARSPGATAVICGPRRLTFQALDAAAEALADDLRRRNLAPGSRVGVLLERSADLCVALLGVLKSGAAYVPLDPAYPIARLAHVVGDSAPAVVVTRAGLRERLGANPPPVMLMEAGAPAGPSPAEPHEGAWGQPPAPDDIAYMIYTSGSTGLPKGVQIPHRALVNLLWAMRERPGLGPADTLLSVTTVAFDIAALELFLPLVTGAKLVIAREHETVGAALLAELRRHQATVMQATPVTWQSLLEAGWRGDPALTMLCGGEALPRPLADQLMATGGALWNMYGPTETTIWSAATRVAPGEGPVLIGPPIANTQFYVLDQQSGLAPPGAPGELFIGGDGVAAGYFNRPELNHERFVPDPFRPAGATLYRTGDLVRLRGAGLEFLGRADNQVKLRGFRIELGEVEATLLRHPDVREAAVSLSQDPSGEAALHAYVALRVPGLSSAALRSWLGQYLSSYMVPSFIAVLPALPRTLNGKVDRRALPAPTAAAAAVTAPPMGATEERLAAIWRSLLGVTEIGPAANFFELGGNSLLAARLLARLEAEFDRRLNMMTLFQAPSLDQLAALLRAPAQQQFEFGQIVRLQADGAKPALIAINNTGIFYLLSRRLPADQPLTALQLFDPTLDRGPSPQTIEAAASEYAELILRAEQTGPYVLLGWCVAGVVALEAAHQLRAAGHDVRLVVLIDAWAPGYHRRLPPLRAFLAGQAYRWHSIGNDCARLLTGKLPLQDFLARRNIHRRLMKRLRPRVAGPASVAMKTYRAGQEYHEQIIAHLTAAGQTYEPKPYDGHTILFTARAEPRSRFLDSALGWRDFMTGRFEVIPIEGDHSAIFQHPGVQQMADAITAALDGGR